MEIVTIPAALVDEFCFYMHHPIKAWLFERIFELVYRISYRLKITHIFLRQLISLKKTVVLSVNSETDPGLILGCCKNLM